jgi:hypothetical protein
MLFMGLKPKTCNPPMPPSTDGHTTLSKQPLSEGPALTLGLDSPFSWQGVLTLHHKLEDQSKDWRIKVFHWCLLTLPWDNFREGNTISLALEVIPVKRLPCALLQSSSKWTIIAYVWSMTLVLFSTVTLLSLVLLLTRSLAGRTHTS